MKLFYLPDTRAIIAKYCNKFVSLPKLEEMNKPEKLLPCKSFLKESKTSNWYDVPDDTEAFHTYLNKYSLDKSSERPSVIKIHKIELTVTYCTDELWKPWFKLTGNVPHYVLNGIAKALKQEYYEFSKRNTNS